MSLTPFDPVGPLPTGTTLLEASAGTGKTWTIGSLVARYVAEGVCRLDQMLIITFTRAATQELRERVRGQLTQLEHALTHPEAPREPHEVLDLLVGVDDDERALRLRRVRAALAGFDEATIATTHEFCALVLRSLGVAGDSDPHARLVEDLDDLTAEVVDDLYLRSLVPDRVPDFSHGTALALARSVVADPQAQIEPADAADAPPTEAGQPQPATRRVRFAQLVRREIDARKRALGLLGYDDLLSQLAAALADDDSLARDRMRQRWPIVLVDEFQDTDPVQWQVLDRAFTGHSTMVLIGDPKQAIYAFRGGDVASYLAAQRVAGTQQTLSVNRRSDSALLERLQALLNGAELGHPDIAVHDVQAHHEGSRLAGAPHPDPFRLRVVPRAAVGGSGGKPLTMPGVRDHVARDLAADVAALLASGAEFDGRPLVPRDVAVLAHTNRTLAQIQEALRLAAVPAVIAGGGSVFETTAATDWLTVLDALEQPHRGSRVRAAALTPLLGMGVAELDAGGERLTEQLTDRMRELAGVVERRGVMAVLEVALAGGMQERVLAEVGGERRLTDLRHVGQALHEHGMTERLGLVALTAWLREQIRDDTAGRSAQVRTRRLDSDAAAVQLVTIHSSKGLEFPVVYLPSLADRWIPPVTDDSVLLYHDADDVRCLDLGGDWPGRADRAARAASEEAGEQLRLLYVAMTRAQSQVVAWWAPANNAKGSPLHRMLFGRGPGDGPVPDVLSVPRDTVAAERLAAWEAAGGPHVEVAEIAEAATPVAPAPQPDLTVRTFDRAVDTHWRRTSYTALSKPLELAGSTRPSVGSEPERLAKQDELPFVWDVETSPEPPPAEAPVPGDVPSPMADLPVGATFGSLVHGVLETADPQAADLRAELLERIDEQLVQWPVELDRELLADALVQVCDSPLGPLAAAIDGRQATLRDLGRADRLSELAFELPLAGGDQPVTRPADDVRLGELAPLLRAHLPAGDPVLSYADLLDAVPDLAAQSLRGYLTGSVDVVLRLRRPEGDRYLVVDYKTNWLGPPDAPLTAAAYRPRALADAMGHSDYPLQALLYAVVLHRFLRWRLPGYRPDEHLGGVLYLYLRGMCGSATPAVDGHPCGVFSWRPPVALVDELSALLDGRRPEVSG